MIEEGDLKVDLEDEVIAGSLLTHAGEIQHQPTAEKQSPLVCFNNLNADRKRALQKDDQAWQSRLS